MKIIQDDVLKKKTKSNFDSNFLSPREIEVLKLICLQKGRNCGSTFISPRTVEGHRNNLLLKTESRNIAGLVVYAVQNSLYN
jgi:DNA-binding CsgD family transcriptional regulator